MAMTTLVDAIGHVPGRKPFPFKLISLIVAFVAIGFTFIQRFQTEPQPARQPLRQGSLFRDALPSRIASNTSLPFDAYGRFQIDGQLNNVALSYIDAIRIDTFEQAIAFEVARPRSDDGRGLRLIVANAGKFIEARPKSGRASIVLKPSVISSLCLYQSPGANYPCSLTLTVMADDAAAYTDAVDFVLSGMIAPMIRHDRPVSVFLPAGQINQVAIQIQPPGVDVTADGSCPQLVMLSAINEADVRTGGLAAVLSSKPDVPADHYSLRIAKDFHLVLMRCDGDCIITIEARSVMIAAAPIVWNWALFARTLLLAIFIFCLLAPTVLLLVAYRPLRSPSVDGQTQASSSPLEELEQERLRNMAVLAAIPLKRFGIDSVRNNIRCSICLEAYRCDDLVRDLACAHQFHSDCCDSWIIDKGHCPLCLQDIGSAINYHSEERCPLSLRRARSL